MASTNPFDDGKPNGSPLSTNPFEDEPSSTNPFDEKVIHGEEDSASSSTDSLENGSIPKASESTNPFDNGDMHRTAGTSSTNPFEDDENEISGKAPNNPFEDGAEFEKLPAEGSIPNATPIKSADGPPPLIPATVIPSAPLTPRKVNLPASKLPTPRASLSKLSTLTPETPTISVTKVLTQLLSVPTNRSCADCRSPLVDSTQVYASFSTNLGKLPTPPPSPETLGSFHFHHQAFAPPSETPASPKHSVLPRKPKQTVDPAVAATHYTGGHGVFLCSACGTAHHNALGSSIATVRYVQGANASWTQEQVQFMAQAGGNARSWAVYEAYMPESWQHRRPTSISTMAGRVLFCRAKYEALAFVTPIGGPLATSAWLKLVQGNDAMEIWDSSEEFYQFDKLTVHPSPFKSPLGSSVGTMQLPSRLVDFFCVVGHNGQLTPSSKRSLSDLTSPEQLSLETNVADCYPSADTYVDTEFPEHISKFVFPDGLQPKATKLAPTFFSFVLTDSNGLRLYGAALQVYDESMDTENLIEAINACDESATLPKWKNTPEVVFLPKCLVVVSHYGFFNLWRHFLLQLYRITLVEAPLPIERYIANFVSEIPLPPQGRIRIKYGLTEDGVCSVSRPAVNQLPLADFSYVPLFASLSVENIMVVMGCLLQESQVAIVSRHYSMLSPVTEALVSLLFPFEWEGIYIPVMPFSMLDVLDAPIPFLVGLHSRYLKVTKPSNRPHGVVFVDLDEDIVHLGFDPETSGPRQAPCLPEKDALKLKSKLQKYGSMVYMSAVQDTSGKARMTTGNGAQLSNSEREAYAQPSSFYGAAPLNERIVALAKTEKAYDNLLTPVSGFLSESGQMSGRESKNEETQSRKKKGLFKKKSSLVGKSNSSMSNSSTSSGVAPAKRGSCLLDDPGPESFSTFEIRNAWLRFFVSLFRNYEDFLVRGTGQRDMFRQEAFLNDLDLGPSSRQFMASVTSTQLFQSFVEDRLSRPDNPAVRFFDESIVAKMNRSKVNTLTTGGKKETPFLDSKSGEILESFTPPPPSNLGLPDDGMGYLYGSFPKLNPNLFGKVRPPKQWPQENQVQKHSTAFLSKQQEIFAKAMKPLTPVSNLAKHVTRDVEWAVRTLSFRDLPKKILFQEPRERRRLTPNSKRSETTKIPSFRSNELPVAQELVLSARRKQGVLLEIGIRIQALCRMYIAKTRYQRFKRAIVCLQRRYRGGVGEMQENEIGKTTRRAVSIQRIIRGFLARKRATVLLDCVLLLQRWARGALVRLSWNRLKRGTVIAQSIVRQRRARFAFLLLRSLICKAQALVRGWLTRKWLTILLETRIALYRPHMVHLWQRAHSPLSFRTKFWPLTKQSGFMQFHLVEEELKRLWGELGVSFDSLVSSVDCTGAQEGKFSDLIDSRTFRIFLMVQGMPSSNGHGGGSVPGFFPGEVPGSEFHSHLEESSERLQLEKLQIYEKLNCCKDKGQLNSCYGAFGISLKEKGKKSRLLDVIWSAYEYADSSTSVMMSLFPELESSTDIHCTKASKKGHRRVHTESLEMSPLDESLLIDVKLANRIKSNMREFATARLNTRQMKEKEISERFCMQKEAAMVVRGHNIWLVCQHEMILSLLYPDDDKR